MPFRFIFNSFLVNGEGLVLGEIVGLGLGINDVTFSLNFHHLSRLSIYMRGFLPSKKTIH